MEITTVFNYTQLDAETRIVVEQRTSEIKTLMRRTAQDIIEIGEKLIEVKERLPHGAFGGWLESEFGWSQETARRFMNVAREFPQIPTGLEFQAKALYLLAEPKTPDEARQEAIARAEAGERITYSTGRDIVDRHKEPKQNGSTFQATVPSPIPADTRPLYGKDEHLEAAIEESALPICEGCGQVYEGATCPDCRPQQPNYKRDNKANREGDIYVPKGYDACQTPPYAIDPLLPYIERFTTIWEPARGEGYLVEGLYDAGFEVVSSDLLDGQNFFDYEPDGLWDCLVTNPPYSIKYPWLERCYQLGQPFALLMPVEMLGAKTAQDMFRVFGLELILLDKRINFKMPNKGWDGAGAQFPVAWFTWGLKIGKEITYATVDRSDQPIY